MLPSNTHCFTNTSVRRLVLTRLCDQAEILNTSLKDCQATFRRLGYGTIDIVLASYETLTEVMKVSDHSLGLAARYRFCFFLLGFLFLNRVYEQ